MNFILNPFFKEIIKDFLFFIAIQLGNLKVAYDLALEAASEDKWKQLAELATSKSEFSLAQECLHRAQDFGKSWLKSISIIKSSILVTLRACPLGVKLKIYQIKQFFNGKYQQLFSHIKWYLPMQ